MSRHRDIRNLNINDELDDDALSDGGEEDMTDEQHAQMQDGLEEVRGILGGEETSGLSDKVIKDALWEFFFDTGKTVEWALDEQQRILQARERKEFHPEKALPSIPQEELERASNLEYYDPEHYEGQHPERSRVPLIVQAQQQLGFNGTLEVSEPGTPRVLRPVLSTITEKTERTDPSLYWRNRQPSLVSSRPLSSAPSSSYGEIIERDRSPIRNSMHIDPNLIPVSPSGSALHRLSFYEPAPSLPASESRSSSSSLSHVASEPTPPSDAIPEIPDFNSKSTKQTTTQTILPVPPPKKSKLSMLASSRASSVTSLTESSRSSGIALTGSVKTFPVLRPSAQSIRPPSSIASSSVGENAEYHRQTSTTPTSTDSHIRRAILTAMNQEAGDQNGQQEDASTPRPHSRVSSEKSRTPTPVKTTELPTVHQTSRPPPPEGQPSRPLSKLALLAQAKADASKAHKLPKPTTEYLTPIANGSSVTTAITTSYQSLYSLTDPARSPIIPKQFVVPLGAVPPVSPEVKKSKLAMKIKKANEKQVSDPEERVVSPILSPMFHPKSTRAPAKEREKAQKKAIGLASASPSRPPSAMNTPTKKKTGLIAKKSGSSTPIRGMSIDQRQLDLAALNLTRDENADNLDEPPPKITFAREKLLEEAKRVIDAEGEHQKKAVSLVVIGHVDAGKSTLMGHLLYELGRLEEKTRIANERGSSKAGKSSFSWAWGLDGTTEERERGITMDIALQSLVTPHRQVTILDAPGHKDFIPNMISGASQADCALLVVDAATGQFEAGFDRGGQTREHLLLVRSLGVSQVIVAVNKLDQVEWSNVRYEEICSLLQPFLVYAGFSPAKTKFVPVGAMQGVNLVTSESEDAKPLRQWYKGPTLVDLLDLLQPPARDIVSPLRVPISNVFKTHGAGAGVSGRLCGGVVQVGERLRILPGDETAIVKSIEVEEKSVPWAAAGSNAMLYMTAVDPVNLAIGSVLCSTTDLVPLATMFTARIIVFDIQVPITAGTSVELFHHSRDVSATMSKLISIIDRVTGKVQKTNPRVLTKGSSAEVQISLRINSISGPSSNSRGIPLEPFTTNKDMGRILIRRGGETIGAGIVVSIEG